MPEPDDFGVTITPPMVERGVEAQIRLWIDTYLRDMERVVGFKSKMLPSVRSYRAADTMEERFPEQQIPAVQIMLTTENKIVTGGDTAHMVFGGTVDVLVQSSEPEPTRRLAAVYAYAIGLLLQQQGPCADESIKVEGFGWSDQGVPALGRPGNRWLALGSINVAVAVQDVFDPLAGPTEPLDEPPNWPVAETTRLILDEES
jgi:hypothetical protein